MAGSQYSYQPTSGTQPSALTPYGSFASPKSFGGGSFATGDQEDLHPHHPEGAEEEPHHQVEDRHHPEEVEEDRHLEEAEEDHHLEEAEEDHHPEEAEEDHHPEEAEEDRHPEELQQTL
ncbi:hypothetical protein L227DRAFT_608529 [Lentinus tigrinus ALCF2SS1-6]|uniref:Uncharacterized protein n=1 Tax=Lentinus tigrinus ALCF2SS1-6 TaxID=1328759 RepID=A0A5C2SRG7_9APHY|nr:hypothetical protein L227DRAFT_608529 [Lentinus tigrinus ALCF2SS1-6]